MLPSAALAHTGVCGRSTDNPESERTGTCTDAPTENHAGGMESRPAMRMGAMDMGSMRGGSAQPENLVPSAASWPASGCGSSVVRQKDPVILREYSLFLSCRSLSFRRALPQPFDIKALIIHRRGPGAEKGGPGRQPPRPAQDRAKYLRYRPGGRPPHRRRQPGGAAGMDASKRRPPQFGRGLFISRLKNILRGCAFEFASHPPPDT